MTTTAWAHLPNAAHIDRVLEAAKANHYLWDIVMTTDRHCARDTTRDFVYKQGRVWLCEAVWDTMWDINREAHNATCIDLSSAVWLARQQGSSAAAWEVARDTILALVAYDDCAYMLDSDPGELAILAKFGDPRALLLLPACEDFHALKETV